MKDRCFAKRKEAVDCERLLNTNALMDTYLRRNTTCPSSQRFAEMAETKATILENYGVEATYHPKEELTQLGLGGPFFGALTTPLGFGAESAKIRHRPLEAAIETGQSLSPVIKILNGTQADMICVPVATLRVENNHRHQWIFRKTCLTGCGRAYAGVRPSSSRDR